MPSPRSIPLPPLLILCGCCLAVAASHAVEPPADAQRIEALERRLGELQARVERLEAEQRRPLQIDPERGVEPAPGGWRTASNWQLLDRGMTDYEVEAILGSPDKRKTVSKFEFWEYGDGRARFYLRRLKSWEIPGGVD